ncbi:hypothetical protein KDD17_09450 [Sulfitobacter albidus]|uniref:EamA domain-containing protein n=1 Tax=Sulfitobacter albidus TaxID=2829501 RepID=A0A975PKZ7_9RHOB|nr:hypothetical protein KDD17_09450 [Sulfitobacter albidus]
MTQLLPDPWIIASVAAALFQTVRFMLQKVLATATLTAAGATFSRFVYALPVVVVLLAVYLRASGAALPTLSGAFWIYGSVGAVAQIIATICVVALFKTRNFAVGITFKKTEVILTVITGAVVLGDAVSLGALGAILLGCWRCCCCRARTARGVCRCAIWATARRGWGSRRARFSPSRR